MSYHTKFELVVCKRDKKGNKLPQKESFTSNDAEWISNRFNQSTKKGRKKGSPAVKA